MKKLVFALIAGLMIALVPGVASAAPSVPQVVSDNIQATYPSGSTIDPGLVVEGNERGGYTYQYVVCRTQPSFWYSTAGFEGTKKSHDDVGNPVTVPTVTEPTDCAWRVFYKYPGQFQLEDLGQWNFTIVP